MMTSIFSCFDMVLLSSNNQFSFVMALLPMMMFTQLFWLFLPGRWALFPILFKMTISLTNSTYGIFIKGFSMTLSSTFYFIIIMNMWGSSPFTMTLTSHLMTTLSMGLPMWMALMMISFTNSIKSTSAHFLPENTPMSMASFLSIVEALSSFIRPITLSFRLAANISAGHVILGMMTTASSSAMSTSLLLILMPLNLTVNSIYLMFELLICLVQAFVFTLLSAMYSSDYTPKKSTST